jgi:hypothetical protein
VTIPAGLRANTLAAVVMLLLQYGLGIGANLYATLPASGHGKSIFPAFAAAITKGPDVVIAHAVLGTLLIITATNALIRSLRARLAPIIVLAAVGLAAIIVAWLFGARFMGTSTDSASLAMAIATGIAILAYTLILFLAAATNTKNNHRGSVAR